MKWVLATSNAGKIKELQYLLKSSPLELVPQTSLGISDIEETGLSFIENALLKARHAAKVSGLPALADDSGLAIDALEGAPGIYSARYAGPDGNATRNIQKVLQAMEHIPLCARTARFYCVITLVEHAQDPIPKIFQGEWVGSILAAPRGKEGFGYDPIFWVEPYQCSAAELSLALKNKISHRAQAIQQLLTYLKI